ncbi:MAG: hypothetical protein H8E47_14495 [Anaerolineales bacterium]|nr:hypothetical protein [Anaerolineales bacterium]
MSPQTFAEMSEVEFDTLIDDYIEREAAGYGDMPAGIFQAVRLASGYAGLKPHARQVKASDRRLSSS